MTQQRLSGAKKTLISSDWSADSDDEFWSLLFDFKGVNAVTEGAGGPNTSRSSERPRPPLNAFYSRVSATGWLDYVGMTVVFPFAVCVRSIWMLISVALAWSFAFIGTAGLTDEDLQKPLSRWRRCIRWFISNILMRSFFVGAGFWWVNVTGQQASPQEAPILVAAPHSSFWDTCVLTKLGAPSVVAKSDTKNNWFSRGLINLTQPVYVERESETSRKKTVEMITERAKQIQSGQMGQQLFIFPEGTTTNRSCLITFKPGAFIPGVPVQPVIIRYPNKYDCIPWTFDGLSGAYSAYLTLLQFANYLEIEFLPVHNPTEEEVKDANLYAQNLRRIMADSLGIPIKDFTYEDGCLMARMRRSSLPKRLKVIRNSRQCLRIKEDRELAFITENNSRNNVEWKVTPQSLLEHMHVKKEDAVTSDELQDLFALLGTGEDVKRIDLREYIFFALLFQTGVAETKLISILFWMYCQDKSSMSKETFISLMGRIFETTENDAIKLFESGGNKDVTINLDSFTAKLLKRVEFVKLYALEETSDIGDNYPPADSRAELKNHKLKVD